MVVIVAIDVTAIIVPRQLSYSLLFLFLFLFFWPLKMPRQTSILPKVKQKRALRMPPRKLPTKRRRWKLNIKQSFLQLVLRTSHAPTFNKAPISVDEKNRQSSQPCFGLCCLIRKYLANHPTKQMLTKCKYSTKIRERPSSPFSFPNIFLVVLPKVLPRASEKP